MGKEKLKEITMEISKLNDSLEIMNYVNSLSDSDIHLFLNYIKNSKYKTMDLYSALKAFSYDYLKNVK